MEFKLRFWGVRGGFPVPGPSTARYGGNTTCAEVRVGGHLIVIDAGTGIIKLGESLVEERKAHGKPLRITLLLTHTHSDHIQGFPFFIPPRLPNTELHIFGPAMFNESLRDILDRAMLPPYFPVELSELPARVGITNIKPSEVIKLSGGNKAPLVYRATEPAQADEPDDSVVVSMLHSYAHPKGGVLIYKISFRDKNLVFATDTEGYKHDDQRLIGFARDADVLVHDAEFTREEYSNSNFSRQGWGHSTWDMAISVAQAANVNRLYLTHHNASHNDDFLDEVEKNAQERFPNAFVAREGLEVDV